MKQKSFIKPDILIYILFAVLIIVSINSKQNLHIDEVFSYGLSNYTQGINPVFEDGVRYEPAGLIFDEYMTVSPDGRFNYPNVWKNQANDVHPPLYYALLHTICSFFVGIFSIWYAGVINIFFSMVILFYLRKIIDLTVPEDMFFKTSVSALFVVLSGILSANTFLRMYIMAMAMSLIFTYLVIKKQKNIEDNRYWIKFSAALILGALTHYYCIIFDVLLCIALGIYFVRNKMKDNTKMLIIASCASGVISVLIFPFMLKHVFFSSRGRQTIRNAITFSIGNYISRVTDFFSIISVELFGGLMFILIAFIVIGYLWAKKRDLAKVTPANFGLVITAAATVAFFLIISKWAVFLEDRYMYVIYPEIFVLIMIAAYSLIGRIIRNAKAGKAVWILILLLMAVGSFVFTGWNYTYRYPSEYSIDKLIADSYEKDAVCIYNESWEVQYLYKDFENLKSVLFIQENDLENYIDQINSGSVLYVSDFLLRDDIKDVLGKKIPDLDGCLRQYSGRGYVYYLK